MATETENQQEVKLKSRVLYFADEDMHVLQAEIDNWLMHNPKYGVKSQQTLTTEAFNGQERKAYFVTVVVVKWLPLMNDNLQRSNGRG